MDDEPVPTLFEIAACFVSKNLNHFSKQAVAGLPVPVLSNLANFLSAQHLDEHEDIFKTNGIIVSRVWLAHLMKRWSRRYQNRAPIFRMPQPPHKHTYLQKHFQDCLQAYLNDSAFEMRCGRNKATAIIRDLSRITKTTLIDRMKVFPYTISTDGGQDQSSKQYPLVIRTLDPVTGGVNSELLSIPVCDGSATDPSTPFRQPLRNEPTFLAKPMVMSDLEKDLEKYAGYANCLITRSTLCHGITSKSNIMETLRKSTKVLETFVPNSLHNQNALVGEFIKLFQDLRLTGCLEELHIHVSSPKFHETFIEIVQGCAGQDVSLRPNIKGMIPLVLGVQPPSQTSSIQESDNALTEDLYDEALSSLASRKSEKEFQQLLEATEKRNVDEDSVMYSASCRDCPKPEDRNNAQGRQLTGFASYDVHCCGETARELAFIFMSWNKLERLAIHYFGGAGSDIPVVEENDPDFALLCQVLLHKVRQHQLTQLVLVEHAVQHGPLLSIVKFYTALISVLNQHYAISSNQGRPMEYLRMPVVCAMEDTQLFGGQKINQPVRAVEDLKVEVDPAYPQNRDMAAQHMAAFVASFIQFDLALTSLTIKDSAAYGFRASDEDILTICSAVTENKQMTSLELDINLTSQVAIGAVVDMIGKNQNLTKVNLKRMSVDWEEMEVRGLQRRLIAAVRNHQRLESLTLKGRLGRALKGTFLVDFVLSLFQGYNLPKLKYLDISETGLTTDDIFRMVAELKKSPCAKYYPALELFSLRNTVKCPNVALNKLTQVKRELRSIAYNVEITFEEMFGFQAEMMAQV